jgi:lysozyme
MSPSDLKQAQEDVAKLIMSLEGFRSHAYLDSTGIKTIGYGSTRDLKGHSIRLYATCTKEEAKSYLEYHLKKYVFPQLEKLDLPPKIYVAVCSLIYNVGSLGLQIKKVLTEKKWDELPECFLSYDKINGLESEGLKNRRLKEIAYFTT